MAVAQAAAVAAPVVAAAAAAHTAACLPTACRRGTSRWALMPSRAPVGMVGGFRWLRRRAQTRARTRRGRARATGRARGLVVVAEFGGTYEDGFEDVHKNIINYFTYKATHTVLHQLYEMNPPSYTWLYNYITVCDPLDGDYFLRLLAKDLAERVMITRLHLYGKWIKKCDHAMMYERISKENLDIMRQRLLETVVWPTDDTSTGD
ncbi:chaperonin-like RbcX protein 2, chloroplastic isoform X2 [Setaria italica]|uniref:chaperonin-like RbcX protein 2, chloroplastic isoform X2 n=1 Tax=Setaria italica TaxID=4555 RepID=UPI000648BB67|nr:chaperonin-like RbcX protein 2, chloroplastic isoform X2 [Setaria italica]XP_034583265.1 chaperonin-like RbcX protein 2, chloroplastic isoform X2 [Setaria viridis]